eukprot:gnl/MRDRNA2_/MRDRNA2_18629_c0_seq1.p1 gnl/MRDRNA2_/MRDRNA2_18629_c0~~gnl/MRDRNA2_/MRDRNA2_18629_c0_seq1.p1  ORF type:complete len:188 (-),score=52.04 gnl/MRDRNA2_/MRDRNA2_18629_c0_seq1:274-837(-)
MARHHVENPQDSEAKGELTEMIAALQAAKTECNYHETPKLSDTKCELSDMIEALQAAKTQCNSAARKHIDDFWSEDPKITKPHSLEGFSIPAIACSVKENAKLQSTMDQSKGVLDGHLLGYHIPDRNSQRNECQDANGIIGELRQDLSAAKTAARAAKLQACTYINWNLPDKVEKQASNGAAPALDN